MDPSLSSFKMVPHFFPGGQYTYSALEIFLSVWWTNWNGCYNCDEYLLKGSYDETKNCEPRNDWHESEGNVTGQQKHVDVDGHRLPAVAVSQGGEECSTKAHAYHYHCGAQFAYSSFPANQIPLREKGKINLSKRHDNHATLHIQENNKIVAKMCDYTAYYDQISLLLEVTTVNQRVNL